MLVAGDRFQLFSGINYSETFASTNLPPLNSGLLWMDKLLVDGSIEAAALPRPRLSGVNLFGVSVVITGTNGPANGTYVVLASTNVTLPVTNWTLVLTNQFDSNGNFIFTNAITPGVPQRFYVLQMP